MIRAYRSCGGQSSCYLSRGYTHFFLLSIHCMVDVVDLFHFYAINFRFYKLNLIA